MTDAAIFVLNENYAYMDLSGFARGFNWGDGIDTTFLYTFEKDGEPAPFYEVLPELLIRIFSDKTEEEATTEEEEAPQEAEEDPVFANGYGVSPKEDAELVFQIGMTEQDLRDRLNVYTFDAEENEIPFEGYTVEGFDASASFNGEVTILLDADHTCEISVLIYDPDKAKKKSLEFSEPIFPKGISLADVGSAFSYSIKWSDETISWYEAAEGLTITMIYSPTYRILTPTDSLDEVGTYLFSARKDELEGGGFLYVFDPENLLPKSIQGSIEITLAQGATIEELRNELYVVVCFDDGSEREVSDYEVVGFTEDATSVTVTYQGLQRVITVYRTETEDAEEEDEERSLTDYLRIADEIEDNADIISAAMKLLRENKELFGSVFTVSKADTSASMHVNINTDDDRDLFAVLNLFIGIPSQGEWTDVDEENLPDLLAELIGAEDLSTFNGMLSFVAGTSLSEMLSDLTMDATLAWDEGVSVRFVLANSEQKEYLRVGIGLRSVQAEPTERTEEELQSAQDFNKMTPTLFLLLSQLLA